MRTIVLRFALVYTYAYGTCGRNLSQLVGCVGVDEFEMYSILNF